jgi:hypothetical protein
MKGSGTPYSPLTMGVMHESPTRLSIIVAEEKSSTDLKIDHPLGSTNRKYWGVQRSGGCSDD